MKRNGYVNIKGFFDFVWLYGLMADLAEKDSHFYVNPLVVRSEDAVTNYEDKSLDFVFIDGDHSYEAVKKDIVDWMPKIKDGAVIGGHDYNWDGVKEAVDEVFGDEAVVVGITWIYSENRILKKFFEAIKLWFKGEYISAIDILNNLLKRSVSEKMSKALEKCKDCIEVVAGIKDLSTFVDDLQQNGALDEVLYNDMWLFWGVENSIINACSLGNFSFQEEILGFLSEKNPFSYRLHELYFYGGRYKEVNSGVFDKYFFNKCIMVAEKLDNPMNRDTYLLASSLKRLGRFEEAETFFQKIIDGEFDKYYSAASMFHAGELAYKRGDYDKSWSLFKQVVNYIPDHMKALEYLGSIKEKRIDSA